MAAAGSRARVTDYRSQRTIDWAGGERESWRDLAEPISRPVNYSVILEETQQRWLYALSLPMDARLSGSGAGSAPAETRIGMTRDFRLIASEPVRRRLEYRLSSAFDYRLEAEGLSPERRRHELRLPKGFNPETQRVAQLWRQQAASDQALIERLLSLYNSEFSYTLEPPLLGRHSVDEFLWQTKRGFCEHFSSSFVFFMRAAGIPARVVVGYQGGERSPLDEYLLVYQYDAHAWAEVWLEGRGWVRVDPTAAVAPSRVERGIAEALGSIESRLLASVFSLERYRHIAVLNALRLRWDSLNYNWHRWVMGYDDQAQASFFSDWLGGVDPWRIALLLLGGGGGFLGMIGLWLWWQGRRKIDPVIKLYQRFCRVLASKGIVRRSGEGPADFTRRAAEAYPRLHTEIVTIGALFQRAAYGDDQVALAELRTCVWRLVLWRRFI